MKFAELPNILILFSAFVPGFIYNGVLANFVPLRQAGERDVLLLRFLTITAANYAICSPLIYLLVFGSMAGDRLSLRLSMWFVIIVVIPVGLATGHGYIVQHDGIGRLCSRLGLRTINPIPTGWDWIFSRVDPCYLLITLADGTEIAGYFGRRSMASSDPTRRDIFLEKTYRVPESGGAWEPVDGSLGVYVDGTQIAFVEFKE